MGINKCNVNKKIRPRKEDIDNKIMSLKDEYNND